jgi:uncharacterized protein (DUF2062 family)
MKALLLRRVVAPLRAQLTQGVTPGKLAAALALGVALGLFPVLGSTTLLCAIAAAALGLNQPAIQIANYLAYPMQLVLLVPFFQAGAWLFGQPPVPFTVDQLRAALASDAAGTIGKYLSANVRAIAAWALAAPPLAGVLFLALRPVLARGSVGREPGGRP